MSNTKQSWIFAIIITMIIGGFAMRSGYKKGKEKYNAMRLEIVNDNTEYTISY